MATLSCEIVRDDASYSSDASKKKKDQERMSLYAAWLQAQQASHLASCLHVGATDAGGLSRDLEKWILSDRGENPFPVAPEDGLHVCVEPEGSTDVYRVSTTAFVLKSADRCSAVGVEAY